MAPDTKDSGTQTVLRAVSILSCFTEERPEWTNAELSKQMDLNQSTVSRLVATLESVGYLQRQPDTGRLRIGLHIAALAFVALSQLELRRLSLPLLEDLSRTTQLNGTLAVMYMDRAMYISRVEVASLYPGNYVLGRVAPLHCSAVGKVLLAHMAPEHQEALIGRMEFTPFTGSTLTDAAELRRQLAECRERGYATDQAEWIPDVGCVAAPVRDQSGTVVAAVGASGLLDRVLAFGEAPLAEAVIASSRKLSYTLGFSRVFA